MRDRDLERDLELESQFQKPRETARQIIVSRHPAAIQFLRERVPSLADAPVFASVTDADVRDAVVFGNIPLHLARLAKSIVAIEFAGAPPRGQEYTAADIIAAGATLHEFVVRNVQQVRGGHTDAVVSADVAAGRPEALARAVNALLALQGDKYLPALGGLIAILRDELEGYCE